MWNIYSSILIKHVIFVYLFIKKTLDLYDLITPGLKSYWKYFE